MNEGDSLTSDILEHLNKINPKAQYSCVYNRFLRVFGVSTVTIKEKDKNVLKITSIINSKYTKIKVFNSRNLPRKELTNLVFG